MNTAYAQSCKSVNILRCLTDYNDKSNYPDMTLADRIKAARTRAGLNQPALSSLSGVKQQVISKLERGIQKETADIVKIAKACGVRPEWLDAEDGPMFYYEGAGETIRESLRVMQALPQELVEENLRNLRTLARLSKQTAPPLDAANQENRVHFKEPATGDEPDDMTRHKLRVERRKQQIKVENDRRHPGFDRRKTKNPEER